MLSLTQTLNLLRSEIEAFYGDQGKTYLAKVDKTNLPLGLTVEQPGITTSIVLSKTQNASVPEAYLQPFDLQTKHYAHWRIFNACTSGEWSRTYKVFKGKNEQTQIQMEIKTEDAGIVFITMAIEKDSRISADNSIEVELDLSLYAGRRHGEKFGALTKSRLGNDLFSDETVGIVLTAKSPAVEDVVVTSSWLLGLSKVFGLRRILLGSGLADSAPMELKAAKRRFENQLRMTESVKLADLENGE